MSPDPHTACIICGAPEPFGLSVCPDCGGAAHAAGDTLIFVKPDASRADRDGAARALEALLDGRTHAAERRLVAAGHQALVRVPNAAADRVVRQLALRDIPALARPARWAWAPVPWTFYLLLATTVVVGGIAGVRAEPLLSWTSPLMATVLLLAAQLRMLQPAVGSRRRRRRFSAAVERTVSETFARLPEGESRDLLARIVSAAETVHRTMRAAPVVPPSEVEALLQHACRGALDLAELNRALGDAGDEPEFDRASHVRDGLRERLRQAARALHRLRAETADADPTRGDWVALLQALDQETAAYADARRDVESLLERAPGG